MAKEGRVRMPRGRNEHSVGEATNDYHLMRTDTNTLVSCSVA